LREWRKDFAPNLTQTRRLKTAKKPEKAIFRLRLMVRRADRRSAGAETESQR
jgi:hypothetical protein